MSNLILFCRFFFQNMFLTWTALTFCQIQSHISSDRKYEFSLIVRQWGPSFLTLLILYCFTAWIEYKAFSPRQGVCWWDLLHHYGVGAPSAFLGIRECEANQDHPGPGGGLQGLRLRQIRDGGRGQETAGETSLVWDPGSRVSPLRVRSRQTTSCWKRENWTSPRL